ncbi:MAG TPA: amidohydrolase [Gemmatimonadaceae bacterium]
MTSASVSRIALLAGSLLAALPAPAQQVVPADLIITGATVWTGDSARPSAQAVAVIGEKILAVGSRDEIMRHRGPQTRVITAPAGAFISPGFIDNHTHFQSAGALLVGVNLLDVATEDGLVRRMREARDRLPQGAWLVGGDWGAYEAWAQGSTGAGGAGQSARPAFSPHRRMIDSITPNTPALLSKWDRSAHLANGRALQLAGVTCDWQGVECENGVPTGRLTSAAAARVRRAIPPKSLEQRLTESRAALAHLRALGLTTIHDNTGPEQMEVYQELYRRGELTTRVYMRPTMDKCPQLRAVGIRPGLGNDWIKIGGLKGFMDGIMGNSSAYFYEPYLTSGERGQWRTMVTEPPGMEPLLFCADSAGYWPMVHAIGDQAIDTLITMMEKVMRTNGPKERRWRVIHTQVIRNAEVAQRMARLGLIAEVQPYHAIDDMRWMEERIGQRGRWAYAFRTLQQAGVRLSFGSDWPGTNAAWYTADPLLGMYAAVTRQTLGGEPEGGWYPQERVDAETALRAYTVNNAWAAGEENSKGKLAPGFLADLVVIDGNPLTVPPARLRDLKVLYTVTGGKVVYDASKDPPAADPARAQIPGR